MSSSDKEILETKIEAARAINDSRFEVILAEIKSTNKRLDKLNDFPSKDRLTWTAILAVATAVALSVAVLNYGSDRYDDGVAVTSSYMTEAVDAQRLSEENRKRLDGIDRKMDIIIDLIQPESQNGANRDRAQPAPAKPPL